MIWKFPDFCWTFVLVTKLLFQLNHDLINAVYRKRMKENKNGNNSKNQKQHFSWKEWCCWSLCPHSPAPVSRPEGHLCQQVPSRHFLMETGWCEEVAALYPILCCHLLCVTAGKILCLLVPWFEIRGSNNSYIIGFGSRLN